MLGENELQKVTKFLVVKAIYRVIYCFPPPLHSELLSIPVEGAVQRLESRDRELESLKKGIKLSTSSWVKPCRAQGVSAPVYLISPLNESDTSAPSSGSPPGFPKNRLLAQYTNLCNLKVM